MNNRLLFLGLICTFALMLFGCSVPVEETAEQPAFVLLIGLVGLAFRT